MSKEYLFHTSQPPAHPFLLINDNKTYIHCYLLHKTKVCSSYKEKLSVHFPEMKNVTHSCITTIIEGNSISLKKVFLELPSNVDISTIAQLSLSVSHHRISFMAVPLSILKTF